MQENFRELRLLVEYAGETRKIAKIAFSDSDTSIYIFPYATEGKYYYGRRGMKEVEFEDQIHFTDDIFADVVPKLSIHESGRVHIKARKDIAGPIFTAPFTEWRGQHIASVSVDNFAALPIHSKSSRDKSSEINHVIPIEGSLQSGRIVLYLAGDRPSFEEPNCRIVVTLKRPTLSHPIYLAIQPKAQDPLSDSDFGGITALAGWHPYPSPESGVDYLYIRGV